MISGPVRDAEASLHREQPGPSLSGERCPGLGGLTGRGAQGSGG